MLAHSSGSAIDVSDDDPRRELTPMRAGGTPAVLTPRRRVAPEVQHQSCVVWPGRVAGGASRRHWALRADGGLTYARVVEARTATAPGATKMAPGGPEGSGGDAHRVALVHDFLVDVRGAERVFARYADLWPQADMFTAVYDEDGRRAASPPQRPHVLPPAPAPAAATFRRAAPALPGGDGAPRPLAATTWWSRARAPGRTACCPGQAPRTSATATTPSATRGIARRARCGRPPRPARGARGDLRALAPVGLRAAHRVTATWRTPRRRGAHRQATSPATPTVVYPPVETQRFAPGRVGEHYLVVSELMAHKASTAVRAFTRLGRELVVVGDGPEGRRLRHLAGPTVRFAGRVSDAEVASLMRSAQALVVTAVEEFGIAAIEAQASGRPVLAADAGGVRETVLEGRTGAFFAPGDADALEALLRTFDPAAFDPAACTANAARFSVARFGRELTAAVESARTATPAQLAG